MNSAEAKKLRDEMFSNNEDLFKSAGIELGKAELKLPTVEKKLFAKAAMAYIVVCILGAGFSIGCILALAYGLKVIFVG